MQNRIGVTGKYEVELHLTKSWEKGFGIGKRRAGWEKERETIKDRKG